MINTKKKIIVILDNIRSALNVGAILRTCDGAGVEEILLCGISPSVNHPKVVKTALGAENYVKATHFESTNKAIEYVREKGYKVFSVEQTDNSKIITQVRLPQNIALIFGNELSGVTPEAILHSDECIEIPMLGKKNSLNVSTTLGIVVYYVRLK